MSYTADLNKFIANHIKKVMPLSNKLEIAHLFAIQQRIYLYPTIGHPEFYKDMEMGCDSSFNYVTNCAILANHIKNLFNMTEQKNKCKKHMDKHCYFINTVGHAFCYYIFNNEYYLIESRQSAQVPTISKCTKEDIVIRLEKVDTVYAARLPTINLLCIRERNILSELQHANYPENDNYGGKHNSRFGILIGAWCDALGDSLVKIFNERLKDDYICESVNNNELLRDEYYRRVCDLYGAEEPAYPQITHEPETYVSYDYGDENQSISEDFARHQQEYYPDLDDKTPEEIESLFNALDD